MRLKRFAAAALAALLMVGMFPTSAFASLQLSDSEQNINNYNPDTLTNSWRYRSSQYGYWGTTSLGVLYTNG